MSEVAAMVYAVLCVGIIGFQLCLIAGAPWGPLTQGGRHPGALPASGRIAAALSIVLLSLMAGAVLSAAGLWLSWPAWAGWTVLGIQALSALLNWITPSPAERRLWGPVTTVMLGLVALVLLG